MSESHTSKVLEKKATPRGTFPHVRRAGNLLFVSGTSSRRADDSFEGVEVGADGIVTKNIGKQTRAVLNNISDILQSMGSRLEDVVDVTAFLVDMDDFDEYNQVYSEFFGFTGPARTTIAAKELPHPNILIEIKVIAQC